MELVTLIFSTLGSIVTEVISWFSALFTGVAEVFYIPAVGDTPAQLTLLGVLALIGVGVGAFYMVFRMIMGFIKLKTN